MIPEGTYLHGNDESEYKQLTMSAEAYYTLKHWSKQRNGTMSKSVMTYEVLSYALNEEFDHLDSYESELDNQLELYGYEDVSDLQTVEGDDARDELKKEARDYMQKDESDYEVGDTVRDVKIWLPSKMKSKVPWSRGWGEKIEAALVTQKASPWDGRNQRIETKKQVLEYERNGTVPDDETAQAIINGRMDEFVTELQFTDEVQSKSEYAARADEWDTWEDRQDRLYEVYNNCQISKEDMVKLVQDAHGISTPWHARNCVDDFAKEYAAYEYAPVDNLDVTPENFVEQIRKYDDSDANRATIINHLLSYYEKQGYEKVKLLEVGELLAGADIISRNEYKFAGKELQRLDKEVAIPSYKKIRNGKILLCSYDMGQNALPTHCMEQMNQVIEDADSELTLENINVEPFVSVDDDMVRQAMLERCLVNEGKRHDLDDIRLAIDTTGWSVPAMYETVKDWISEFTVVEVVDNYDNVILVEKHR